MGGGQSKPFRIVVREDPYPTTAGAGGLSLSQAEGCNACQVGVDTKITMSNVNLKREQGAITPTQCKLYEKDVDRVANRYMSMSEFVGKLQSGVYSRPVSERPASGGRPSEQYCETLRIDTKDAESLVSSGDVNLIRPYVKQDRIVRVASASYSESTKAKIIPSIPFQMSFAAKKAAFDGKGKIVYRDVSESFPVTQMTLYHPSPVRIDSVQADAILSLNDPTDSQAKYIVLIPLRGTNSGQSSTDFFSKIAQQLMAIREPDPATSEYATMTIPTGADWSLSKLFTLSGNVGTSTVKNGFFTWTGVAGYERYQKPQTAGDIDSGNGISYITYGWKQTEGLAAPQYIMLDTALDIRMEDLAALTQSLPVTPPAEAIHPIPGQANLVYHKSSEAPAPDTLSGKSSCAFPNLCEGFTTGTLDQSVLNSCPGAKCDPFLQNAMLTQDTSNQYFTARGLFSFFLQFLVFVAMLLGAYLALRMVSEDYDLSVRNFAEKMGRVLAVWTKGAVSKVQSARSALSGLGGLGNIGKGGLGGLKSVAQGNAEGFAEQAKSAVSKKGEGIMGELDRALGSNANGKDGLGSALSSVGNLLKKPSA
jgi:hypothetical protein